MRSISDTVNTKIVLKTDGQPALVQVQDRVISVRTQPTIPENKPVYDPQANGGAERAVQEVRKTLEGNQIGVRGQKRRGDHGYHGHLGVDDPAGCGYDKQVLVWARWTHSLLKSTTQQNSMARCMSTNRSKKEGALEPRFHDATWVGYNDWSKTTSLF